jgi:hypothetical protein
MINRIMVAALLLFLVGDVSAKDLPSARAYRQILDVCIEQTLLNREAIPNFSEAGAQCWSTAGVWLIWRWQSSRQPISNHC